MNLLLIEDSAEYAELVQHWISSGEHASAFCLNWTDTLVGGLNRLSQGGVDAILLDLGLPDSDGLETFVKTQGHAAGIPIIILSGSDSEALALRMIQAGAADYLVKSTCSVEALVRAVKYAVVRQKSQSGERGAMPSAGSQMIAVMGAKGGVGTTTVACNLALELRRQTGQAVLLADLNVNAGLVSLVFGLEPAYSLRDAVRSIHHLDQTCWERIVTHSTDDLHILPSPGLLGESELSADSILQVLTLVRPFYDWIVLDMGRLDVPLMRLRHRLNDLLIVTDTAIAALYETKRVVSALTKTGAGEERLRLVVNQITEGEALSGSEMHKIFGIPVYARLKHDRRELENASLRGKLPAESSMLRKQIASLARKMAGLPEERSRRGLPRLLSFTDRFRKTGENGAHEHAETL